MVNVNSTQRIVKTTQRQYVKFNLKIDLNTNRILKIDLKIDFNTNTEFYYVDFRVSK